MLDDDVVSHDKSALGFTCGDDTMHAVRLLALSGLLAASAALAKDKPAPPKRDEPPQATGCEFVGPGYVKVPGSDTCVKIEGSVRSDAAILGR